MFGDLLHGEVEALCLLSVYNLNSLRYKCKLQSVFESLVLCIAI